MEKPELCIIVLRPKKRTSSKALLVVELTVELFACACIIVELVACKIVVEKAVVFCVNAEGTGIVDSYIGVFITDIEFWCGIVACVLCCPCIVDSDVVVPADRQSFSAILHFPLFLKYLWKSFLSFGGFKSLRQAVYLRLQTFCNIESENDMVVEENTVVDENGVDSVLAGLGVGNATGAK